MAMAGEHCGVLQKADLQRLLDVLSVKGYRVVGLTVRDGSVVWESIRFVSDLPIGGAITKNRRAIDWNRPVPPKSSVSSTGRNR